MTGTQTIFAPATAQGRGAIAIIRISGPATSIILSRIAAPQPRARHAALRAITAEDGEILDQGLVLWFPGPRSYTGEDMAELHLHAGHAVIGAVLDLLRRSGGCPAEPGEFTMRAFLNGRMDLLQAEGLADLIEAETEAQRRQALRQASGGLSEVHASWSASMRRILALQEGSIDFPDEIDAGDGGEEASRLAVDLAAELSRQLRRGERAQALRRGVTVAITGAPNVGKSSLLNALADRAVAIVSARPGTTRDVVEARLVICDVPVTFFDTAGIRESNDEIEREGVARALEAAAAADLVLEVIGPDGQPSGRKGALLVANKIDLCPPPPGVIGVSAKTAEGLDRLRQNLASAVKQLVPGGVDPAVTRVRHRDCLQRCIEHLACAARQTLPELRGEEYRQAARALGRLTGVIDIEDVLGDIFATFCIGK